MKHPPPVRRIISTRNQAPRLSPVEVIVIHHTASENIDGVLSEFKNPTSEKSAHFVVGRDGSVVQVVPPEMVAWHCRGANQQSVGIEVVANRRRILPPQEKALRELVAHLLERFQLTYRSVTGHKYEGTTVTECPGNLFDQWGSVFHWAKEAFRQDFPVRVS